MKRATVLGRLTTLRVEAQAGAAAAHAMFLSGLRERREQRSGSPTARRTYRPRRETFSCYAGP